MGKDKRKNPHRIISFFTIRGWAVLALVSFAAAVFTFTQTATLDRSLSSECGHSIVAMEMAGSTVSAAAIITDYQTCRIGDSPGLEVARTLQNLDWLLIAAYTLALFSALCLLSLMTGLKPLGKNVLIFYLPPVIGGLDCLENVVMSILFDRFPDIVEWHVEVMTLAAFLKFALSIILLFALAYLFGCWLMDWSSRRGKTTDPQIQRT
ncbi:MAG: hypothetical protein V2I36_10055, partial [Desulfopila sp.]|nr:hypothetical protein [Desulfopila sp.]